jgi:hypothetical protein
MEDELDLIAGGDGEDGDELPVLPEVIVVAHADHTSYYMPNHFNWGGGPGQFIVTILNLAMQPQYVSMS